MSIKWFSAAFGAVFGLGASLLLSAAPGDLVYQSGGNKVEVTAPQAACFAQCAIAAGVWDGSQADMVRTCVMRDENSDTNFSAFAIGLKTAPSAEIVPPVQVVGVVE